MTNLKPATVGWGLDNVTLPITSAKRTVLPPSTVANADQGPAHGRLAVADQIASRETIARNQHMLIDPGPDAVHNQKRLAIRLLRFMQRLHQKQLPALQARVLHRGN